MSLNGRLARGAILIVLALLWGCGATTVDDEPDSGRPAQRDASSSVPGSEGGVDQNPSNPVCNEQSFLPERIADPDIIILMDMSGSMSEGSPTKYRQTADAVINVITELETSGSPIWWGLLFFPTDGNCGVDPSTLIPPAANNANTIADTINAKSPDGNTPAHKAVIAASQFYQTLSDDRAHYLLIATDGLPNCDSASGFPKLCNPNNPVACAPTEICEPVPMLGGVCLPADGGETVAAISAAANAGIKTFVIGIEMDGSSKTLNKMAEAGGTARAGSPKFYPVSDQASMVATLQTITQLIVSCTFQLSQQPPDLEYVYVSVGGQPITRDPSHANGWDIDTNSRTLTFYGDACTTLQTNPDAVSVVYGCPPLD